MALLLVSPEAKTGRQSGSATTTAVSVWFPSFVTVTVYWIGSPAPPTVGTDGDLVMVMCGPASTATVSESSPETAPPRGSSAFRLAVFWIRPASTSSWVTEYAQVSIQVSPTSKRPLRLASPEL